MKNRLTKLFALATSAVICLACVGCGGNKTDDKDEAWNGKKIVIYRESNDALGADEESVKTAVQQKYYEDTGIKLDLQFTLLTQNNFKTEVNNAVEEGLQLDAISGRTGLDGGGVETFALSGDDNKGYYKDLSDLLDEYGTNLKKNISADAWARLTTSTNEIIGIPGEENPSKYGILVRKDLMQKVGYTDDATDGSGKKEVKTIDDFIDMCKKMTDRIELTSKKSSYVISGQLWDLERVLYGAYTPSGYYSGYALDKNGNLIPGYLSEGYKNAVQATYEWASYKNNNMTLIKTDNASDTVLEGDFIAGRAGVCIQWPEISHLIKVARRCKQENPNAEFCILGPLTDNDGNTYGFKCEPLCAEACVIMKDSENAVDVIKFMDWMYSDVNNLMLCQYGIEGKHWVNVDDSTYKYPEGKEEDYIINRQVFGLYGIVKNNVMLNKTLDSYTQEERGWIDKVRGFKRYEDPMNTLLLPSVPNEQAFRDEVTARGSLFAYIQRMLWGTLDPAGTEKSFESVLAEYNGAAGEYLKWLANEYNFIKG